MDTNDTQRVVENYFRAWTSKNVDAAFACLAPELVFVGPTARYTSAAEFRPALAGFAAVTKSATITHMVVSGGMAAMLYDCELPDPAGTIRIASFFRVENGKIVWYETQFDPTGFKQLRKS